MLPLFKLTCRLIVVYMYAIVSVDKSNWHCCMNFIVFVICIRLSSIIFLKTSSIWNLFDKTLVNIPNSIDMILQYHHQYHHQTSWIISRMICQGDLYAFQYYLAKLIRDYILNMVHIGWPSKKVGQIRNSFCRLFPKSYSRTNITNYSGTLQWPLKAMLLRSSLRNPPKELHNFYC